MFVDKHKSKMIFIFKTVVYMIGRSNKPFTKLK